MKIKSILLFLLLSGVCYAEQKVVFITAYTRHNLTICETNTKNLDPYIKSGWKIINISGSGAGTSGGVRIWAVVIEKTEIPPTAPPKDTKIECEKNPVHGGLG